MGMVAGAWMIVNRRLEGPALLRYLARTGKEAPYCPAYTYNRQTGYLEPSPPPIPPTLAAKEPTTFWNGLKAFLGW